MVRIRLSRGGSNRRPFYHVVVMDSRVKRDGRALERIGYFNPLLERDRGAERLRIDLSRADYWLERGAQVSTRVARLLKEQRTAG